MLDVTNVFIVPNILVVSEKKKNILGIDNLDHNLKSYSKT